MVLASGTAIAQIITAASMPIVTRLYTPEMIGVISVFLSFFNFWLVLLSWRYESALLVSQNEEESHHVFSSFSGTCFSQCGTRGPSTGLADFCEFAWVRCFARMGALRRFPFFVGIRVVYGLPFMAAPTAGNTGYQFLCNISFRRQCGYTSYYRSPQFGGVWAFSG